MKRTIIVTITLILSVLMARASAEDIKNADLAGSWYPGSGAALRKTLQSALDAARPEQVRGDIFAVISPHAGYRYSAPVAAYGFKAVAGKGFTTVVIVGFTHRRSFEGIAVYDRGAFRTPLGDSAVDGELAKKIIAADKRISFNPQAFDEENSVEMQVPFVQLALPGARIVPIAFGTQDYRDAVILADALAAALAGRRDCLVVASTDLSHYHSYDEATVIDKRTIAFIEAMQAKALYGETMARSCELCGLLPVTATMLAAEKLGFNDVAVLNYANSGDIAGNKDEVVGYVSAAIYRASGRLSADGVQQKKKEKKEIRMLNDAQRRRLLAIARESIVSAVKDGRRATFTEDDPQLRAVCGAFVTIHENGSLRGCIGNMIGHGPLYTTVAAMAVEAATGDPRFPPLSAKELDAIELEISVLSPLRRIKDLDEIMIPGHGVLVKKGLRSGVYLPQVADETGWSKEEFMASLCAEKAGLPQDAWKDPATEVYVFNAEVFGEQGG